MYQQAGMFGNSAIIISSLYKFRLLAHYLVIHKLLGLTNITWLMFQFPTRSHTVAAQGGINAALGNMTEGKTLFRPYHMLPLNTTR
jgi:hypothetical protein